MSIFVDALRKYPPVYADRQAARVGARNRHEWCHMVADDAGGVAFVKLLALAGEASRAWGNE